MTTDDGRRDGTRTSHGQQSEDRDRYSRRGFLKGVGTAAVAGGLATGPGLRMLDTQGLTEKGGGDKHERAAPPARPPRPRIAADPTDMPAPVDWSEPRTHDITLTCEEMKAEIEPGVTFSYMTFGGRVPGPMIRVRQGDTVRFTLENLPDSVMVHNMDFHAVYGTGGGAEATNVAPGQAERIQFKATYPGAFIYHCAVPSFDYHVSSGMFGMIVVEPPEGLPPVDHEFYLAQQEVYTNKAAGEEGQHQFDFEAMLAENPTYVLLNGQKHALTESGFGALRTQTGDTARIFFVNGGPNLTGSFHAIGNVWTKAWREGATESAPARNAQTIGVPPGSCGIFEMEFPVPETIKLVDHAVTRSLRKGFLGHIKVDGAPRPEIYDPEPSPFSAASD